MENKTDKYIEKFRNTMLTIVFLFVIIYPSVVHIYQKYSCPELTSTQLNLEFVNNLTLKFKYC